MLAFQNGGKLLGQGTFGCVFSPPLRCEGTRAALQPNPKRVGKISEAVDAEAELLAARILRTIPNASRQFLIPDVKSVCTPGPRQDDSSVEACEFLERANLRRTIQFTLPMGGSSLVHSAINQREFPFQSFMNRLLECGALLTLHSLVHQDIHGGNVLLTKDNMPQLIDFGQTFLGPETNDTILSERWKVQTPENGTEPPEVTVATGIRKRYKFAKVLRDVSSQKEGILLAERVLQMPREAQARSFEQFWNTSKAAQTQNWDRFFQMYWPGFDSWSIGVILTRILRQMLTVPDFIQSSDWKLKGPIVMQVLRGMMQMNPRKRIDCVQALYQFNPSHALFDGAGANWIQAREGSRGGGPSELESPPL